jgi:hypothetical protein
VDESEQGKSIPRILYNFTSLEGKLADEEFSRLLVTTNFTECDGSGLEAIRLLDPTSSNLTSRENADVSCLRGALHLQEFAVVVVVEAKGE